MEFQFSFRHMKTSDALRSYADQKLRDKITRLDPRAIQAHVSFEVDNNYRNIIHCTLLGGDGTKYFVEHTDTLDMFAALDQLVEKVGVQLKRHKGKAQNRRVKEAAKGLEILIQKDLAAHAPEPIDAGDIVKFEQARQRYA